MEDKGCGRELLHVLVHFGMYHGVYNQNGLFSARIVIGESKNSQAMLVSRRYHLLQISQRDILNSIEREMSGDLKEGFKAVGRNHM